MHGNAFALEAAIDQINALRCDSLVFLGDAAATGPEPARAIETLAQLDGIAILGNTDAWLLDISLAPSSPETAMLRDIAEWCRDALSSDHMSYLRCLSATAEISIFGDQSLLCYHGSPRSYDDVIDDSTDPAVLASYLEGVTSDFLAGGHTHRQMLRGVQSALFMNPGSIGLSRRSRDPLPTSWSMNPWAQFAILDVSERSWNIELRTVGLDVDAMLRRARRSKMPHLAWWSSLWRQ